jgi:hypothetical protein
MASNRASTGAIALDTTSVIAAIISSLVGAHGSGPLPLTHALAEDTIIICLLMIPPRLYQVLVLEPVHGPSRLRPDLVLEPGKKA